MAERLVTGTAGTTPGREIAATRGKNRTRAKPPPLKEAALHATVANLLGWTLAPPAMFTTFPAGWGKFTPALAGLLSRCGLKPGMPDILVFHAGRCVGLELKVQGSYQTPGQREMAERLRAAGVRVHVAHSVDEVMAVLRAENIPLRKVSL